MFTREFKEKAEDFYELKDFDPNHFLRFFKVIHTINLLRTCSILETSSSANSFFAFAKIFFSRRPRKKRGWQKLALATPFNLNRCWEGWS
ncbi:hypothetical protein L596_012973 [Steinernema carpocapsae]|uniref:Uncharacterized protein n=1 Tax=Steinernema carpocapsae TaxID=34508 RepID=A0A4U5NZN9_STECR|nr:hypothetical protein L596_012973 [Steinernema carpocapsae]